MPNLDEGPGGCSVPHATCHRAAARKAFVYLDTSNAKRVQQAMLEDAAPIAVKYEVGDVVVV